MTTIAQQSDTKERMTISHRVNFDVHHYVAKVMQGFGTVFFRILFYTLFNIEIRGKENISREKGPVIIVANHVVFFDSFMFHLFFRPGSSLLPLRFLGVTKFIAPALNVVSRLGLVNLVYLLFGVSIVTQGEGLEKNLKNPIEILKKGGTVTIFPAGRMRSDNSLGEFKRGAAVLAQITGAPIIPVSVKRFKVRGKRTKFVLNAGSKFYVDALLSQEDATAAIREKVEELHTQVS